MIHFMGMTRFAGIGERKPTEARIKQRQSQEAHADAFVLLHRDRKAVAKAVAHAPIPTFDYMTAWYSDDNIRRFLDASFTYREKALTGKELLSFLLTPKSVDTYYPASPDRMSPLEFKLNGRSELELRRFFEENGIDYPSAYEGIVREARQYGLVYMLKDLKQKGGSYYGIPLRVRKVLEKQGIVFEPPQVSAPVVAEQKPADKPLTPFGEGLKEFLERHQGLAQTDELFEYLSQLSRAAVQAELISLEMLPKLYQNQVAKPHAYIEPLDSTLLTILEFAMADGPNAAGPVASLCRKAVDAGVLREEELREVLKLSV